MLVDIELFMDIRRIEEALTQRSCTEALAWCSENKVALRKMKVSPLSVNQRILSIDANQSALEFELRLQEYIELSRARKAQEAIAYSKRYLVPWQETHMGQIWAASALLAFPPNTTCAPYKVRLIFHSNNNRLKSSSVCTVHRDGTTWSIYFVWPFTH